MKKKLLIFLTLSILFSVGIDKSLDYYVMDIKIDSDSYYSDHNFPKIVFVKFKYQFFIDPTLKHLFTYNSHDSYFKSDYK